MGRASAEAVVLPVVCMAWRVQVLLEEAQGELAGGAGGQGQDQVAPPSEQEALSWCVVWCGVC